MDIMPISREGWEGRGGNVTSMCHPGENMNSLSLDFTAVFTVIAIGCMYPGDKDSGN
jgi:hypothetical protein